MKALSLTVPWSILVAIQAKLIETRSWSTSYRGQLAIHSATGLSPVGGKRGLSQLINEPPFWQVLRAAGYEDIDDLPRGCIVATCNLVNVVPVYGVEAGWEISITRGQKTFDYSWDLTDQERAFGNYTAGRYAWLLADVEMLPEPIPAKGALGIWEWAP